MNRKSLSYAVVASIGLVAGVVISQEKRSDAQKPEKPSEADVQAWIKLTQPGVHHQGLASLAGAWNLTVKQPDSDGKWIESKGTAEFTWAMGGRFLIEQVKTEVSGQPFEWLGIHGYDNQSNKHVSAWIDNLGTGIDQMVGECDASGKVITYIDEVEGGGGDARVKWVIRIESRDRTLTQMFDVRGDGRDEKVMEILATRAN